MIISIHRLRRTIVVISAVSLLAGGSAASAANIRPAGLSVQAYKAQMTRAQALNQRYGLETTGPSAADLIRAAALDKRYGNAWTRVSPAEFTMLVNAFGPEVTNLTPQQARAELARGQGLNTAAKVYATSAGTVSSSGTGFHWGDAGIGVAAAFGVMLLAAAGAIAFRKRSRVVLP
jgi:hypothetical protein